MVYVSSGNMPYETSSYSKCIFPIAKSRAYPKSIVIIPTVIPTFSISFCLTSPVENAIAFGGVDIGRHIALDAATAKPTKMVVVPPIAPKESPIPLQTVARMGASSAAVAVLLMKLDRI